MNPVWQLKLTRQSQLPTLRPLPSFHPTDTVFRIPFCAGTTRKRTFVTMRVSLTHVAVIVIVAIFAAVSGCALISNGASALQEVRSTFRIGGPPGKPAPNRLLPGIVKARDVIEIQIFSAERPVDDPLLSQKLWQEIDEVAALSFQERSVLEASGFRIGHASSSPPRLLQEVLKTPLLDFSELNEDPHGEKFVGRRVVLQSGAQAEIPTSPFVPELSIDVGSGEEHEILELKNVRCVLRMSARKVERGWVTLDFLPEIHHGDQRLRYTGTANGFQTVTRQQIHKLYQRKFSITLNLGEMAVITAGPTPPGVSREQPKSVPLGQQFFVGADGDFRIQQLKIIRLAHMSTSEPIYAE